MRIALLATGGTIACRQTPDGLSPALHAEELAKSIACRDGVTLLPVDVFSMDSSNIQPEEWTQLAHAVEREAPQLAIHYYQQVLQVDGCREQTAAQLMQLAARFGNRSLVNATFEHLKGALRTLGAAPLPATAALYQQLH